MHDARSISPGLGRTVFLLVAALSFGCSSGESSTTAASSTGAGGHPPSDGGPGGSPAIDAGSDAEPADPCATDNGGCSPDAACKATEGTPVCACNAGYTGDGVTCADIDECAKNNGDCSAHATCTNTPGSRTCACNSGYTGTGLACSDIDECAKNNGDCAPDATCTNTPGSHGCACKTGYTGDGVTCVDIDECATDNGGCSPDATCANTSGSHACTCKMGYSGDGVTCVDIDECATNNGGCSAHATCANTVGSRVCDCNPGFSGDGVTCVDIDECATNNGGCSLDATCANTPGSHACTCKMGYSGDGVTCVDIDECATNNGGCSAHATCANTLGSRVCTCDNGYAGNGVVCQCSSNLPPSANAGSPQTITYGTAFSLDGTASAGGSGALTYAWTAAIGSPPLVGANSATPSGVATDCGTFSYTVTVTDLCGHSAAASVSVTIVGNGPYVSGATCTVHQCGTIARPWCSIGSGIAKSQSSPVMVAGDSSTAYFEDVVMANGVDVLGGYEPTFTAPRNTTPGSNGTAIRSFGAAFTFPAGVTATLDGFAIGTFKSNVPPASLAPLVVSGSAVATVANVTTLEVDPTILTAFATSTYAVDVSPGIGGSLLIKGNSTLRALRASSVSAAINVRAGVGGPITLNGATVVGGPAPQSFGIRHAGTGALDAQSAAINAGAGATTSTGILAGGPGYGGTTLTATTVLAGVAPTAIGLDHTLGSLTITGGSVTGQGTSGATAKTIGVRADGSTVVAITGAQIIGSTAVGAVNSATTIGLQLLNTPGTPGVSASVVQATVNGGSLSNNRTGIFTTGVPLTLTQSTVAGSQSAGGNVTVGVDVAGTFPAGATIDLSGNTALTGGDVASNNASILFHAAGVRIKTTTPVAVNDNALVQGCTFACKGVGIGVYIQLGSGLTVAGNTKVVGGPAFNGGYEHAGIHLSGTSSGLTTMQITGNTLIAGNLDPANRPFYAYGIYGRGALLTIASNARITGGYSASPVTYDDHAVGLFLDAPFPVSGMPPSWNLLDIHDNEIDGGSGRRSIGALVGGSTATFERNVVDACGIAGAGAPAPECLTGKSSWGLWPHNDNGSVYSNNYVFGGYAPQATGCVVGCDGSECAPGERASFVLDSNLCLAPGQPSIPNYVSEARGLVTYDWLSPYPPVIRNNILDAGFAAGQRYDLFYQTLMYPFTFINNDLVPLTQPAYKACLAGTGINTGICLQTPLAVDAASIPTVSFINTVAIDPAYVAPDIFAPTAAGYHLGPTCTLADQAVAAGLVTTDYDGEPRGTGANGYPEIGPDECY